MSFGATVTYSGLVDLSDVVLSDSEVVVAPYRVNTFPFSSTA
jgi:hypothetical protein